jgi:hypothetical protein
VARLAEQGFRRDPYEPYSAASLPAHEPRLLGSTALLAAKHSRLEQPRSRRGRHGDEELVAFQLLLTKRRFTGCTAQACNTGLAERYPQFARCCEPARLSATWRFGKVVASNRFSRGGG